MVRVPMVFPPDITSHRIPSHDLLPAIATYKNATGSARGAQDSSQFKKQFQEPATQLDTGSLQAVVLPSFIFLEPSPGCLSMASARVGQASQVCDLKRAHVSEVQLPPCEPG